MVMKSCLHLTTLCLACLLDLGMNASFPALAKSQYSSVGQAKFSSSEVEGTGLKGWRKNIFGGGLRAPRTTTAGAVRGSCTEETVNIPGTTKIEKRPVTALWPKTDTEKSTYVGLTVSENPTLFFYVPTTDAKSAVITLTEEGKDDVVYEKTFEISKSHGVVGLTLSNNGDSSPLKLNKQYHWQFRLRCDPDEKTGADSVVDGGIKRVAQTSVLQNKLQKAAMADRPYIYAEAGYWTDTLKSLADSLAANPQDRLVKASWQDLLKSQGIAQGIDEDIAEAQLLNCCQAQEQSTESSNQ